MNRKVNKKDLQPKHERKICTKIIPPPPRPIPLPHPNPELFRLEVKSTRKSIARAPQTYIFLLFAKRKGQANI